MSQRFNVTFSDDLYSAIDRVARGAGIDHGEILRKALQLFLAAHEGKERGLRVGLVDAEQKLETEFIGL